MMMEKIKSGVGLKAAKVRKPIEPKKEEGGKMDSQSTKKPSSNFNSRSTVAMEPSKSFQAEI